jgi:hypothetical protein
MATSWYEPMEQDLPNSTVHFSKREPWFHSTDYMNPVATEWKFWGNTQKPACGCSHRSNTDKFLIIAGILGFTYFVINGLPA